MTNVDTNGRQRIETLEKEVAELKEKVRIAEWHRENNEKFVNDLSNRITEVHNRVLKLEG